ncbi:hypothetical protein [Azospirillum sp. TSO5]|uniref:hypothetical protein n=1 Tax=Azospirillum sp. TSO5 TaxID=716760 RepID=UPI0011B254DE|nr:hypothetical protein [Azospirillum sp. TSO5]
MSARRPVTTNLPGVTQLHPTINAASGTGSFVDKEGSVRTFAYGCDFQGADPFLTIAVEDATFSTFKPWPAPHEKTWSASGIDVHHRGKGIAKNIYAAARDILAPHGISIAPSDNLFDDGMKLWKSLDPAIEMEEQPDRPTYYRPKL